MTTLPHELLPYKSRESDRCCTINNNRISNILFIDKLHPNNQVYFFNDEYIRINYTLYFTPSINLEIYPINPLIYDDNNFILDEMIENSDSLEERTGMIQQFNNNVDLLEFFIEFDDNFLYRIDNPIVICENIQLKRENIIMHNCVINF